MVGQTFLPHLPSALSSNNLISSNHTSFWKNFSFSFCSFRPRTPPLLPAYIIYSLPLESSTGTHVLLNTLYLFVSFLRIFYLTLPFLSIHFKSQPCLLPPPLPSFVLDRLSLFPSYPCITATPIIPSQVSCWTKPSSEHPSSYFRIPAVGEYHNIVI